MVDFTPQNGPHMGATMTTFRVASGPNGHNGTGSPAPGPSMTKSRMGATTHGATNGATPSGAGSFPLSARKAQPLDLTTVERRGQGPPNRESPKPNRMFGLQEAPTYRPTTEDFKDPLQYIAKIREEAQHFGICKIIPPDSWNPAFAIDTEVSRTRCLVALACFSP